MKKVGMISLGCSKNTVDAEHMLYLLENNGYEICGSLEDCEIVIVNTCTFIEAAKKESIDAILEAASYKNVGKLKKIIVTGCMAQRYKNEIHELMPEVDSVLGSKSFDRICDAVENLDFFECFESLEKETPEGGRILTTPDYSVYVKIADGCSNHCSYCVIPSVRGEFMPRDYENVIEEIRTLAFNGAKEINIIAQDTTKYPELCKLIKETCRINSVKWVRILYLRPEGVSDELLNLMRNEEKFVSYMDIPLQHASGTVLKRMNRNGDDKTLLRLIEHIRKTVKEVSLRTTFITGFPKESEEEFVTLCEFVKKAKFDNMGVFAYSREEGTPAGRMHGQINEDIKNHRRDLLMQLQLCLLYTSRCV